VQQQTYKNWELVVVDDAPVDQRAAAMVKKFLDSRMNFIRHETNRGQAAARTTAILACRAKYFLPLDCDDVLDVTHVEKLVQA
jgi:glycosyltransferase involved in cell wall biosynthesis